MTDQAHGIIVRAHLGAGTRVHAGDCVHCDEREVAWVERIQTAVTIHGRFDELQRQRLAQVARRCPVHQTLANGVALVDAVTFVPVTVP